MRSQSALSSRRILGLGGCLLVSVLLFMTSYQTSGHTRGAGRGEAISFYRDHRRPLPAACLEDSVLRMLREDRRRLLVTTTTKPSFWISMPPKVEDTIRWDLAENGKCCGDATTRVFMTILGKGNNPSDDRALRGIVVDAGTNVGWYSLYSMAMGYQVYSFEPNSRVLSRFCEGVYQNGFEDRVVVFHAALGGEAKDKVVLTQPKNPGAGTLQTDKVTEDNVVYREEVPLLTLDDVMGDKDAKLLKIDVEGFEYQVLKGALKWLQRARVDYILVELSVDDFGRQNLDALEMFGWLRDRGYRPISFDFFDDPRDDATLLKSCRDEISRHQCDMLWKRRD